MGRLDVQRAEARHDVLADMHLAPRKYFFALAGGVAVAGEYHGEAAADLGKNARIVRDAVGIAAVSAADQQEYVGVYASDLFGVVLGKLERIGLQHLSASAEARRLRRFRGKLRYEPAREHPKPARRRGTGVSFRKIEPARHALKLMKRVGKPVHYVGLDRCV